MQRRETRLARCVRDLPVGGVERNAAAVQLFDGGLFVFAVERQIAGEVARDGVSSAFRRQTWCLGYTYGIADARACLEYIRVEEGVCRGLGARMAAWFLDILAASGVSRLRA